jgi:Dyp-type peroxidase family
MARRKTVPLFSLDRPLSEDDLRAYRMELAAMQGNILKVHGREATVSIFLTFRRGKIAAARRFIHTFARRVTSANEQERQVKAFKKSRKTRLFTGFCLTAAGYQFLGRDTEGFSQQFRAGMRGARGRLADPPVDRWEPHFRGQIHAMVTFAHDYPSELSKELSALRTLVGSFATVSSEFGLTMRNAKHWAIEHFGFVDGRSQPLFFEKEVRREKRTDRNEGPNYDPSAGPELLLVKDPHGNSDTECGTYVVFRKLEQNVKGFKQQEKALAKRLHLAKDELDLAGALIVGRFRDGTPLVLEGNGNGERRNNFTYEDDRHGNRCPFFAHVRKANPRRDSLAPYSTERSHRIARRGITYGDPTPPGDEESTWPETGVGLLFQCCQADLGHQFEFIQRRWVNNPDFARRDTGYDPLAGQAGATPTSVPSRWGGSRRQNFDFETFVRMRGGEYFFAPSIRVLRRI